jgi:hypothetical protein
MLRNIAEEAVLTVGETGDFLENGGMISFIIDEKHVRFIVNHESIRRAGLRMSSKLLKLAALNETAADRE